MVTCRVIRYPLYAEVAESTVQMHEKPQPTAGRVGGESEVLIGYVSWFRSAKGPSYSVGVWRAQKLEPKCEKVKSSERVDH